MDWLLIRLNEEDLPRAFDPRGFNLEVHTGSGPAGGRNKQQQQPVVSTLEDVLRVCVVLCLASAAVGSALLLLLTCDTDAPLFSTALGDLVDLDRYRDHADAPRTLFGAPVKSSSPSPATPALTSANGLTANGSTFPSLLLRRNFAQALQFFRRCFATSSTEHAARTNSSSSSSPAAAIVGADAAAVLDELSEDACIEHRQQVVGELSACRSIFTDDFLCVPVADGSSSSGDGSASGLYVLAISSRG